MACVILFALLMGVQNPDEFVSVEEFLSDIARKFFLYNIVVLVLTQPYTDRNREAKLLFLRLRI